MPQSLSDRLSIDQIGRLWAAETENATFGAGDIAGDLVKAAELGEFEHTIYTRANAPLRKYTYKEDWIEPKKSKTLKGEQRYVGPYRSALSMQDDRQVNSINIVNYIKTRASAPGATDRETRRIVARDIFLSVDGLRRWCDEPGFTEWAKLRGLSRPRFIDRAIGDGTGQASAVDQEPKEADAPSPSPPPARRRGRRPQYDWALFHTEIARKVGKDPDGFPVIQADLERTMTDWCVATWGENKCPSESTIRSQVSKHYNDDSQGR